MSTRLRNPCYLKRTVRGFTGGSEMENRFKMPVKPKVRCYFRFAIEGAGHRSTISDHGPGVCDLLNC